MRVVVPLWLVLLAAVSLAPDHVKYHLGTKGSFHSTAHFIALALTGLLFCWKATSLRMRLAGVLAGCCVALALEFLERWFYGNPLEWSDVWIGCLGVVFGFTIATVWHGTKTLAWFVRK